MPVIALDETKEWMGVTSAATDDLITALITRVEEFIQNQTSRFFGASTSHTEYIFGDGTGTLWLNEPASSITSIHERSYVGETWTEIVAGDDDGFELQGRKVYRKNWLPWTLGREYRVIYAFGYATAPEDIRQLALDLVKLKFNERDPEFNVALQSYQIGDTRWTRAMSDEALMAIPFVAETIGHWRGLRRGVA